MELDSLTRLPTRAEFARQVGTSPAKALALFDVAGVRGLNDCYGHKSGDLVIAAVSALLQKVCPRALLGRSGGTEFVALFEDVDTAVTAAEQVRSQVMFDFFPEERAEALGVSPQALRAVKVKAGVVDTAMCQSLSNAFDEVERAMYQAKALGPGHVVVGRPELRFDRLTGLRSRHDFDIALQFALKGYSSFALLYADIDMFKRFNDVCGYALGDEVLQAMGAALRQATGDATAARYGGDQFVALVLPCGKHEVERIAQQTWSTLASSTSRFKARLQDESGDIDPEGQRRRPLGVSMSALWVPQAARLKFQDVMETVHDLAGQMRHLDSTGYVCMRLPERVGDFVTR